MTKRPGESMSALEVETMVQERRFKLEGKGGDGDPPYARDMSIMRAKFGSVLQGYRPDRSGD